MRGISGRLLRRRDFRRLFAVRLASQLGDGVFQVALASYVLFSPERAPDAAAIAGLFAVALLPYSILGPFTGVLLDRWSRRQILFGANLVRAGLVLAVAGGGCCGQRRSRLLRAWSLLTLGVNRFLLSGLSAGLPHVVDRDELVMANAVTPTAGTACSSSVAGSAHCSAGLAAPTSSCSFTASAIYAACARCSRCGSAATSSARTSPAPGPGPGGDPQHRGRAGRRRPAPAGAPPGRARPGRDRVAAVPLRPGHGRDDPAVPQPLLLPRPARRRIRRAGAGVRRGRRGPVHRRPGHALGKPGDPLRRWVTLLLLLAAWRRRCPVGCIPGRRPGRRVRPRLLCPGCQDQRGHAGADRCRRRVPRPGLLVYDMIFNAAQVPAAALAAVLLPDDGQSYPVLALSSSGS